MSVALQFPKPKVRGPKKRRTWRDALTPDELAFVEFVELHRCSVPGCRANRRLIEFDHWPTRGSQGKSHAKGWPLCGFHHKEKGNLGVDSFQDEHGINFETIYERLREKFAARGKP